MSPSDSIDSCLNQTLNGSFIVQTNDKSKYDHKEVKNEGSTKKIVDNKNQVPNGQLSQRKESLLPDFSNTINTNFTMTKIGTKPEDKANDTSSPSCQKANDPHGHEIERSSSAFNFSKFEKILANQIERRELMSTSLPNDMLDAVGNLETDPRTLPCSAAGSSNDASAPPSVWSMDVCDGFLVLGCSSGRIELWETFSGKFRVN